MSDSYEQDLRIDPTALDVEWLRQAGLYMEYAEQAADARKEVDAIKDELDVLRAEIAGEVRDDPTAFGLEKITEAAVASAVVRDERVVSKQKEMNSARHSSEILTAALRAFDHKKAALENLVRLHGQSYFAGPSVPRDLELEAEKIIDAEGRTRAKVKGKLNKGKGDDSKSRRSTRK